MNYTIIENPAFTVFGKTLRVSIKNGENLRRIPEFWAESRVNGLIDKLSKRADGQIYPAGSVLGVCTDFSADMDQFTYVIGSEQSAVADKGLTKIDVPSTSWAVFAAIGSLPDSIQSIWKRLWPEFFDVSEYRHTDAPDIELYPPGDPRSVDYLCEVWVPVNRK